MGKELSDIKLVATGAGAACIACVNLLMSMGVKLERIRMGDLDGVIYAGRSEGMNRWKEPFAIETEDRTLEEALHDADVFLGLSAPKVLTGELMQSMAEHGRGSVGPGYGQPDTGNHARRGVRCTS